MHPRQTDRSLPVARSPRCWSTQPPLWVCLAFGVGLAATVSRRWIDIDGSFCADEGFFALAARNVMGGARPYRDFLCCPTCMPSGLGSSGPQSKPAGRALPC